MPRRTTPPEDDTPLDELWNLSGTTASWLIQLGISCYGDLRKQDLYWLWSELKLRHREVTKLMFYALWGAVNNCHWRGVPESEIRAFEGYRHQLGEQP